MARCPVEFTMQALKDLEDISAIARELSARADQGQVLCGQPDPQTRQLFIGPTRVVYRVEADQITVLCAEVDPLRIH